MAQSKVKQPPAENQNGSPIEEDLLTASRLQTNLLQSTARRLDALEARIDAARIKVKPQWLWAGAGIVAALLLIGIVQIALLIGTGAVVRNIASDNAVRDAAALREAALANRPVVAVTPKDFVCPDAEAMRSVELADPSAQVCTLAIELLNRSARFAAQNVKIIELDILADGREFERLQGINHEIGDFSLPAGQSAILEIPVIAHGAPAGPGASSEGLVQVHLQLKHAAAEDSGAAGEYWYRYHWQAGPRGFSLKSSESELPESRP